METSNSDDDDRFEVHELNDDNVKHIGQTGVESEAEWETDIEDIEIDDFLKVLSKHKEPVYCIDLFKDTGVIVTGSQDEKSFVWDSKSDTQLAVIEGHTDTVTSVAFHPNDPYLATADMVGLIQVFSTESNDRLWKYECGLDLELILWHPVAKVLFAGLANGDVYMLKVGTDELKCYSGGLGDAVSSMKLIENGLDLIVGYANSAIKCWNLKTCSVISTSKLSHSVEMPVSKIDLFKPDQFFACTTESVCLVNFKTGKILAKFGQLNAESEMNLLSDAETAEVETFSICPSSPNLLCIGRNNGRIETWDIAANCMRTTAKTEGAITKMLFPRKSLEPMCLAATTAGVVVCLDAVTGNILRTFRGHHGTIYDMVLAFDDSFFVTCGEDTTVKLFSLS